VTYPIFLSDFNETRKFWADLWKYVKFHENLFSRSRVILCEQIDVTKLIVTFVVGKSGLMLMIDRLSLSLLCSFVAPRDGRTVRLLHAVMCERSVDMVFVIYWVVGVLSCFSFHSFKWIQHNNLFP